MGALPGRDALSASRLAGAVVGAAILIPLPELLRDLQQYQRLIYGLTLILLLLFMPQGLAGLWRKWRGARKEAA